jgi:secondary thiamine-phosphate synthase enzyme
LTGGNKVVRYINIRTRERTEFIDITGKIQEVLNESGKTSGVCNIFVPHTTAAVTVNEGADPTVQRDIQMQLTRLVPFDGDYHHREGNSSAHIKTSLIGVSQTVLIDQGKLVLGTWQSIFFCEFDGPRHRRIALRIISDE